MSHRGIGFAVVALAIGGCAARTPNVVSASSRGAVPVSGEVVSGVWDGVLQETVASGAGAGDSRTERQEWHLVQRGPNISGYYVAALTYTSGDGRPYVCSRQPTFSALVRFDVSGHVRGKAIDLEEVAQRTSEGRCTPGTRPLTRYQAEVRGDVLTLVAEGQRQMLYRNHASPGAPEVVQAAATPAGPREPIVAGTHAVSIEPEGPRLPEPMSSQNPADVSGVWIWEHRGAVPTGDEKQEREEWHVEQDGTRITGYYDRVVRQISTDGHAFKCSMDLEFQIATRYRIRGEVRGNQIVIYENSYEVLEPNACDNGQRRLDAYEGQASGDEVRLVWGVGGQVLRRPRPDVPTQRF